MLVGDSICEPSAVCLESEAGRHKLDAGSDGIWQSGSIRVQLEGGRLSLRSPEHHPIRLHLSWRCSIPAGARFLNDHWERGYGDLRWGGLGSESFFPWYLMAVDGEKTFGCGVKVRPNAFCHWLLVNGEIRLVCDLRNGHLPLELGERRLEVAELVARSFDQVSPYEATEDFCGMLCADPLPLTAPVYGFNDWYYIYGQNSRETVLRDTDTLCALSEGNAVRPFSVIDDGWQVNHNRVSGGPWQSNALFGDMADLAREIKARGARPGIWMRPLLTYERLPKDWIASTTEDAQVLDPSHPEVLARVEADVRRLHDWGYELIKHDFTTFDITGLWGFDMGPGVIGPDALAFHDRSRTTAEIILALYRTIRRAAGDSLLIGCNTMGHLAAGLVELQRTGDDTSGKEWARTRKMGINTLAFRMPQHNRFFAADADCVGLTTEIPWELNRQWLDLLARSGTPLFVSADPAALGPEQREALKAAFQAASTVMPAAEPLDWLDTTTPSQWQTADGRRSYDWWLPIDAGG